MRRFDSDELRRNNENGGQCLKSFWGMHFLFLTLIGIAIVNFDPSFSIQAFYVPALNKFTNQSTLPDADSLIFFNLALENGLTYKGVLYDPVNLTFSYAAGNTSIAVGTYSIAGFYQGKKKKTQRQDVVVVTDSAPWREAAMSALSSGSTANFTVVLDTKVRFNNYLFVTGKERVVGRVMIQVDDSGRKVVEKPVKLSNRRTRSQWLIYIFTTIGVFVGSFLLCCFSLCVCGSCFFHWALRNGNENLLS